MTPLDTILTVIALLFAGLFFYGQVQAARKEREAAAERRDVYDRLQAGTLAALDSHKQREQAVKTNEETAADRRARAEEDLKMVQKLAHAQLEADTEFAGELTEAMSLSAARFGG
jgi:aldehyde:ferredoxin oxidoreductase